MPLSPPLIGAVAVLAGIALGQALALPWWLPALAAAALAGWWARAQAWPGSGPRTTAWALALALGLAAWSHLAWVDSAALPPDDVSAWADCQRHQVVCDLARAPMPGPHSVLADAWVREVDGRAASGWLRLYLPPGGPRPGVGERLRARVKLRPVTGFANPGSFDYARFLAGQGIRATAWVGPRADLSPAGPGRLDPFAGSVQAARQGLSRLLDRLEPGEARELIRALVLGMRRGLGPDTRRGFSELGLAHLLAISGLHLGLVWGLAWLVLRYALAAWPGLALRWPVPKLAALGALVPAAAYAALAGGATPTLRALVMAACLGLALVWDRQHRPLNALALAAILIGLAWPREVLGLSFQLSFVAVAAILLVAAPLARRLRGGSWLGRLGGALGGWVVVSAVVGLAVLPLGLGAFHVMPWLSLPANLVVMPILTLACLPLALAGAGLGLVWPAGGLAIWQAALVPAGWALGLIGEAASWEGAATYHAGPSPWLTVLIYALAAAVIALRGRWRLALAGGLALAALAVGIIQAQPPAADGRLSVRVLDVGQGMAAVARLPQGQTLVIDGGGVWAGGLDKGERVVAPFLWRAGWPEPTALVCSHRDSDHAGGLAFLARWLTPREVWTSGGRAGEEAQYDRLLAAAAARGVPVLGPRDLGREQDLGGARVILAWPRPGEAPPQRENDRSLWLGLGLGETWVWFPGDVGPGVERKVAPFLPPGRHVLVAPHHGGKGSCTRELLAGLKPEIVVISAGCCNQFDMPRPEVVARIRAAGARILTTAEAGAVELVSDGRAWTAAPHLVPPRRLPRP